MQKFEYKDRDGDFLFINRDSADGLEISVRLKDITEYFIFIEDEDAPMIARALLERAGHKAGGPTFADAAVGALKDHEKVTSKQRKDDEKVAKYFKEVRQQTLNTVLDWHREEFKRVEKFNKEVFGRRPRKVEFDDLDDLDTSVMWKAESVGNVYFTFKYVDGFWYRKSSSPGSDWKFYGSSLNLLSHFYFPLEEVLD